MLKVDSHQTVAIAVRCRNYLAFSKKLDNIHENAFIILYLNRNNDDIIMFLTNAGYRIYQIPQRQSESDCLDD
jgi:hypothetical protein